MNLAKLMRNMLVGLPALALVACATAHPPPQELVDARAAYAQARSGNAPALVPVPLNDARAALDRAEYVNHKCPGTADARDAAYIALRQAQRVEALGKLAADTAARAAAEAERAKTQNEIIQSQQAMLDKTKAQAEETSSTVITLPGEVLFETGQSVLLPGARVKLDKVAEALEEGPGEHHFVVEGNTDSTGTDAINNELSDRRANAVREYLISRGVEPETISAEGHGSQRPIADNHTPEGRAMNRRVEIIVGRGAPASAER